MPNSSHVPKKPNVKFLLAHPAHFIAQGFGAGLAPKAPGTFGTLLAWILFYFLYPFLVNLVPFFWWLFIFIATLASLWAIDKTGKSLGEMDHGSIVIDEIIPFWLVLSFVEIAELSFIWQTLAFVFFRFFDIVKPQPARFFDQKVKNAFGVLMDDFVAAMYSILALWILSLII